MPTQNSAEPPRSRNNSYLSAVRSDSSLTPGDDGVSTKVKAGAQRVLQVFITNAANVFLLDPPGTEVLLDEQVPAMSQIQLSEKVVVSVEKMRNSLSWSVSVVEHTSVVIEMLQRSPLLLERQERVFERNEINLFLLHF